MRTTVRSALPHRLEQSLAAVTDVEQLAHAVFAAVAPEVPYVLACLATVDPASGLITRAFKSHPLPLGDHEFTAAEYGAPDVNRFAELATRPVPVGALFLDTGGVPAVCHRFREFMAPRFGFTDELRAACRSGSMMWGALAVYRGEGDPPFTRGDAAIFAEIHEVIATALMRVVTAVADRVTDPVAPIVLVLDEHGRVESRSGAAEALIGALGGWDAGALPASLLAAASAARSTSAPTASRIRTGGGDWLAIRAVPVSSLAGVHSVVLTVDTPPAAAIGRLRLAARGLTAREAEIVQQVLLGASTKEMAATLHLSAHTVQDHLKAVFAKLGIGSRRELIAQFVE